MGRINEHRLRVRSKIQTTKDKFEKGMIVSCRYTPKETGVAKEYMMLILNPNFQQKVHALSLDEFGYVILNQLAEQIGLAYIKKLQKVRKVDFPKLQMAESSKRFYFGKLKKDISKKWGDSYRTFNLDSIGSSFVTDYKFNTAVEKKFLTSPVSDKDAKNIIKGI